METLLSRSLPGSIFIATINLRPRDARYCPPRQQCNKRFNFLPVTNDGAFDISMGADNSTRGAETRFWTCRVITMGHRNREKRREREFRPRVTDLFRAAYWFCLIKRTSREVDG